MKVTLLCCQSTILDEIAEKTSKKKNIAQTYALILKSDEQVDWKVINTAIIQRWSRSALNDIKKMAWSGKCFKTKDSK